MARYLLSALITPFPPQDNEATFRLRRISLDQAREARWATLAPLSSFPTC